MSLLRKKFIYVLGLSLGLSLSACANNGEVESKEIINEARVELDDISSELPNEDTEFEKTKTLAMQGDAIAQRELGINYRYGFDVSEDLEEAASWIEKAAENGDAEAQYMLASMYDLGQGVDLDKEKALEWNLRSANQGYADAQFVLAQDYLLGWSSAPQDSNKSFEWATKGALQEHNMSQRWLAMLYEKGIGTQKNKTIAKAWYYKACDPDAVDGDFACEDYKRLDAEGY